MSDLVFNRAAPSLHVLMTVNATVGQRVRRVVQNGKEWLVAPVTSLRNRVLPGSKGPLLYPTQEIINSVPQWDNKPLTWGHPHDPVTNAPLSAKDRGVWQRQGLGHLRNTRWERNGLRHEAWFDAAKTRQTAPEVYNALIHNRPIECSTGLFTDNHPAQPGATHNGDGYDAVARNYGADHVAVLTGERGACSVADGCGVNVTNANPKGINQYTAGQTVRFEGKSADGSVEGGMDVKVINPHSNAHEVAFTKGGRQYDKDGHSHLPIATVERPERKMLNGDVKPAKQFEAYHHTLRPTTNAYVDPKEGCSGDS